MALRIYFLYRIDFGTKIPKKPIYIMKEAADKLVCNYSLGDGHLNVENAEHPRQNCYMASGLDKK